MPTLSARCAGLTRRLRLAVPSLLVLAAASAASAGDLDSVLTDLYGGDGITLPTAGHDAHFTGESLAALSALNDAISGSLRLPSLSSTVTSFTFDTQQAVFVRATDSLGPLLAERADTVGEGKLNVAFNYTRVTYDQFEGTNLDDLDVVFTHVDVPPDGFGNPGFELDEILVEIDYSLTQDIYAVFGTFGLTDSWDVGAVIPILHNEAKAVAFARVIDNFGFDVHDFDDTPPAGVVPDGPASRVGREDTGIGDILLRTKWNFLSGHELAPDMAVRGQVSLPTGNEDDLMGIGEAGFEVLFVASKRYWIVTPHLNVGYEILTGGDDNFLTTYVTGLDVAPHERVTLAADILGRHSLDNDGNEVGDDIVQAAFGAKINVFKTFTIGGVVQIPVNPNDGLRDHLIWTVGGEVTFF